MTSYQRDQLHKLARLLQQIDQQAQDDQSFNELLTDLGIFTASIDECAARVINVVVLSVN